MTDSIFQKSLDRKTNRQGARSSPPERSGSVDVGLPLFWYKGFANFGDRLAPFLTESVSGRKACYSETGPKLLALGSILPFAESNDVVWGSGAWHEKNRFPGALRVHAVRGPLTRRLLLRQGIDCPEIYGDPALLLSKYYRPKLQKHRGITVLRHFRDDCFPAGGDRSLSVREEPFSLIDKIASSEILVTSTLHGLIVAETYGVPVVLLRNREHCKVEPQFKYADYFASTGRPDLTLFDVSIREAVQKPLPPPTLPDLDRLEAAFPRRFSGTKTSGLYPAGEIDDPARWIRDLLNEKMANVFFCPEHGDDLLEWIGLKHLLDRSGVDWRIMPFGEPVRGETLFFCGGDFVPYYGRCKRWLALYEKDNRCVVLPRTIDDDSVRRLSHRTILLCADRESFDFCRRRASCETYLSRNMSHYIDPERLPFETKRGRNRLAVLRRDVESSDLFAVPESSVMLPECLTEPPSPERAVQDAERFLSQLNEFDEIVTDRLNVAIAASRLGKRGILLPNSYYKNKAAYDYSLKDDPNIRWAESPNR